MNYNQFRKTVINSDNRNHSIKNSLGVYDAYKYIRKNKWFSIGKTVSEKEFYTIIRTVNTIIADHLSNGEDINLPCKMGRLEIRKRLNKAFYRDGKLIVTHPILWNETLKLWFEDEEAFKNKTLIKSTGRETFELKYNKSKADYSNKMFYKFNFNREVKQRLKNNINNNNIDAYMI